MSLLTEITPKNDLGHPLCGNLREGHWICDYTFRRLQQHSGTRQLGDWFEARFAPLKDIPKYLLPCYFDIVISQAYSALLTHAWELMSE